MKNPEGHSASSVALSADGSLVATGDAVGQVVVWNVQNPEKKNWTIGNDPGSSEAGMFISSQALTPSALLPEGKWIAWDKDCQQMDARS